MAYHFVQKEAHVIIVENNNTVKINRELTKLFQMVERILDQWHTSLSEKNQ